MSGAFVKLYGAILDSSIWLEDTSTRLVWITMLAMADANGVVHASTGGLAHRARVDRDDCARALEVLRGPDPDSRDETSGERITKVEGGWLLVNHRRYRDLRTEKHVQGAERQKRYRERHRNDRDVASPPEAEAEADPKANSESESRARPPARSSTTVPEKKSLSAEDALDEIAHRRLEPTDCYRGTCAVHKPLVDPGPPPPPNEPNSTATTISEQVKTGHVDPLAAAILAALAADKRASKLGLAELSYAEKLLGVLAVAPYPLDADGAGEAIRDALADLPAGANEQFARKMVRSYLKQQARKPPGELQHRRDAPKPKRRRPKPTEPEPLAAVMSAGEIAKLAAKAAGAVKGGA